MLILLVGNRWVLMTRPTLRLSHWSRVGQHCQKVFSFEVMVVRENFVVRHAGTQQFQQNLNGIPQPPHARLPVTDLRVDGDSVDERWHEFIFKRESCGRGLGLCSQVAGTKSLLHQRWLRQLSIGILNSSFGWALSELLDGNKRAIDWMIYPKLILC